MRRTTNYAALAASALIWVVGKALAGNGPLIITTTRVPGNRVAIVLKIENPTSYTWCLNPVSFSPSQFDVKIGDRVIGSRAPHISLAHVQCLILKAGETQEREVNLRTAFTPGEFRHGALCYTFAYSRHPMPPKGASGPLGEMGTICEGREGREYLMPTE